MFSELNPNLYLSDNMLEELKASLEQNPNHNQPVRNPGMVIRKDVEITPVFAVEAPTSEELR